MNKTNVLLSMTEWNGHPITTFRGHPDPRGGQAALHRSAHHLIATGRPSGRLTRNRSQREPSS